MGTYYSHEIVTKKRAVDLPTDRGHHAVFESHGSSPPFLPSLTQTERPGNQCALWKVWGPADPSSNPSSSTNYKLEHDTFLAGFPICEIGIIMLSFRDVVRTKLNYIIHTGSPEHSERLINSGFLFLL